MSSSCWNGGLGRVCGRGPLGLRIGVNRDYPGVVLYVTSGYRRLQSQDEGLKKLDTVVVRV